MTYDTDFNSTLLDTLPDAPRVGYRLHSLEVFNWGTFDRDIWKITPNGSTSLLTGANGSGKSTLVDALLTLIVPPSRRGFNLASGAEGRKRGERTVDSYFHGEYGHTRDEENNNRDQLLRLRGDNSYSVLCALFVNAAGRPITLAQLVYAGNDGKAEPIYIVAEDVLEIQTHLTFNGDVRGFKRRLQEQGCRVYDEFSKYSADFKRLFGLRSDNALVLFNKIVSMKEMGPLNEFVRESMLDPLNVRERIENLYKNYQNLNDLYRVIQRDERALQQLNPLADASAKAERTRHDLEEANRCMVIVPAYMAYRKGVLLDAEIQDVETHLGSLRIELDSAKMQRESKQIEAESLRFSIQTDRVGSQIQALKKDIDSRKALMRPKNQRANAYNAIAVRVGLPSYTDALKFQTNSDTVQRHLSELADSEAVLDRNLRDQYRLADDSQTLCSEYEQTLNAMRTAKNKLDWHLTDLRDRLTAALNLESAELPFVGELLQVREDQHEWEAAIEKLLHGYAQRLLVTPALYDAVRQYIEQTTLNNRIVYNVVYKPRQKAERPTERTLILYKLDIKEDTDQQFIDWLANDLVQTWSYACVPDVRDFAAQTRAITARGQIKHSESRHEKDDRQFGKADTYVLGWNNQAKIAALEAQLREAQAQLAAARRLIDKLENERRQFREQQNDLRDMAAFTTFEEIDWRPDQAQIDTWVADLRTLESSSDQLQTLQNQLNVVVTDLKALDLQIQQITGAIGGFENKLDRYRDDRDVCSALERNVPPDANDYVPRIEDFLKGKSITLATIDQITRDAQANFDKSAASYRGQVTSAENDIRHRITTFHKEATFAELVRTLDDSFEALADYLDLKGRLEQDDLPRHHDHFRAMMNENIAQDIVAFREELERKVAEYKERIETLNESLRRIVYDRQNETYIQLKYEKRSSTDDISNFRAALDSAIPNQMRPDLIESYYEPIRILLERLKTEPEWAKRVTDPRQWLEFYAQEFSKDGRGGETHSNSSGKSGGQKAKLAYTVLASAIADQYSINQETEDTAHAFRFVVVDEVFSKLDESNAQFAMQLFQQLQLQVLIVTPMDKVHIVEPFIGAVHIISNANGNKSTVLDLSIETYQSDRARYIGG